MNIKNTMCRISELSKGQVDSLRAAMPVSGYFNFGRSEPYIGLDESGVAGNWSGRSGYKTILTYNEMMQLLTGKSMGFTKADLIELAKTETVFVKYRKGDYRIYLDGIFNGENWVSIDDFNEDLNSSTHSRVDIMSVYTCNPHQALLGQLEGIGLTQVWERTELTPEQKQMEDLKKQAAEIVKKGTELKIKMEALQAGIDAASKL